MVLLAKNCNPKALTPRTTDITKINLTKADTKRSEIKRMAGLPKPKNHRNLLSKKTPQKTFLNNPLAPYILPPSTLDLIYINPHSSLTLFESKIILLKT